LAAESDRVVEVIDPGGQDSLSLEKVVRGHHRFPAAAHHGEFLEDRQYLLRLVEVHVEVVHQIEI
jgi:hypothetical protein